MVDLYEVLNDSAAPLRVETQQHAFLLDPGKNLVTHSRYLAAIAAGARPVTPLPPPPVASVAWTAPVAANDPTIAATVSADVQKAAEDLELVIVAVQEILDSGDKAKITVDGKPRMNELRELFPEATEELRDQAMTRLAASEK